MRSVNFFVPRESSTDGHHHHGALLDVRSLNGRRTHRAARLQEGLSQMIADAIAQG